MAVISNQAHHQQGSIIPPHTLLALLSAHHQQGSIIPPHTLLALLSAHHQQGSIIPPHTLLALLSAHHQQGSIIPPHTLLALLGAHHQQGSIIPPHTLLALLGTLQTYAHTCDPREDAKLLHIKLSSRLNTIPHISYTDPMNAQGCSICSHIHAKPDTPGNISPALCPGISWAAQTP